MRHGSGNVPHFTLRPHPVVTFVLFLVLVVGLLTAMSFFSREDGTGGPRHTGIVILILTGIISFCLTLAATAKMWFTHLWKRNSTHARHKQHTQHHPSLKEQEYRKHR